MDVQCERCKAEYEFDDALVSGRGTTVRCTQCGHQFKVRRLDAQAPEDKWIVTTAVGQQLTYVTLRELQRAIMAKQVGRGDTLAHGSGPPRLLGSIAELEPFFEGRGSARPSGTNEAGGGGVVFPKRTPAWGTEAASPATTTTQRAPLPEVSPPRPRSNTLRPPDHA